MATKRDKAKQTKLIFGIAIVVLIATLAFVLAFQVPGVEAKFAALQKAQVKEKAKIAALPSKPTEIAKPLPSRPVEQVMVCSKFRPICLQGYYCALGPGEQYGICKPDSSKPADPCAPKYDPSEPPQPATGPQDIVYTRFEEELGTGNIWKMNSNGTSPIKLTYLDVYRAYDSAWSPDGNYVAFTRTVPGCRMALYVMNADGTNQREVIQLKKYHIDVGRPVWSADEKIYFADCTILYNETKGCWSIAIYSVNVNGTNLQQLTYPDDGENHIYPTVYRNTLIFAHDNNLKKLDLSTGAVTDLNRKGTQPDYSCDGWLVYSDESEYEYWLEVLDASGNKIDMDFGGTKPSWNNVVATIKIAKISPDKKTIATKESMIESSSLYSNSDTVPRQFIVGRGDGFWIVNMDGSRTLIDNGTNGYNNTNPDWKKSC